MSKKTNLRDCPAVGRPIKSIECGENRHRAYACPADCPHSPFSLGNYEQFGALEDRVDSATISQALADPEVGPLLSSLKSHPGEPGWTGDLVHLFFKARGSDGLTFSERWENAGYRGLRGDDKTLFERKRKIRFALLEVQQVIDYETARVVDLLDDPNKPILIVDRSFAARACRFDRVASIAYPAPNYLRLLGSLVHVPFAGPLAPLQTLQEAARHLGGNLEQSWLMSNVGPLFKTLLEIDRERQRLALLNSDLVTAKIDYQLHKPVQSIYAKLRKAGFEIDDLSDEERANGWQRSYLLAETAHDAGPIMLGTPYIGTVAVKKGMARLSASSEANKSRLRDAFERACGSDATFQGEFVSDHAMKQAIENLSHGESSLPPVLLQGIGAFSMQSSRFAYPEDEDIADFVAENAIQRYYRQIIDSPVPQLANQTPRQAAKDAQLRPALVEWAKGLAKSIDTQNLSSGTNVDINWIFAELGLPEIDFPPPPPRAAPPSVTNEADEYDDEYDEMDDLEDYLQERLDEYPTAADALDDMAASGCDIVNELADAMSGLIDEDRFAVLAPLIILAWLGLVPREKTLSLAPGCVAREAERFFESSQALANEDAPEAMMVAKLCRDPSLLIYLLDRFDSLNKTLPKKMRYKDQQKAAATATLAIAINILADAPDDTLPFSR